jgi:hypothetical protein
MSNPLLNIIRKAYERKWCTEPYCTTCGGREYRDALNELAGPLGGSLANALEEINPQDLISIPNWQDALLIAIFDVPFSPQLEGVLQAWLPKIPNNIFFADFVLYKIVRHLPTDNEMKNKWIESCVSIVLDTNNFSLIESIILVLRKDALNYPNLIAIAEEQAKTSAQMRKVLRNACK